MSDGNREIDRKVAEWMGWERCFGRLGCSNCPYDLTPEEQHYTLDADSKAMGCFIDDDRILAPWGSCPTEDAKLAREVEAEIEEKGVKFWRLFIHELTLILGCNLMDDWWPKNFMKIRRATPLQRMQALVRVIEGDKK